MSLILGVTFSDRSDSHQCSYPFKIANLLETLSDHITSILDSLPSDQTISPVDARLITEPVHKHAENTETWYLTRHCIDRTGLERPVSIRTEWKEPSPTTNIWPK